MRLTLRTLLAYRDRVLSPGDREDLHSRVQKSEPASNLLRRIDSVASQKNLGAPQPIGTGLGSDPNSVSEYLDDVMPAAQVPEMEVVCLNSDVQLGELAQCHTILSSAVLQQIDVPQPLYDRVLKFGSVGRQASTPAKNPDGQSQPIMRVDKAHIDVRTQSESVSRSESVEVTVPMVASAGTSIAPQGLDLENSSLSHEVPEYLVGTRRGAWGIPLAIGGLLALLCILLWQTLGPWDRVASLFEKDSIVSTPAADSGEAVSQVSDRDDAESLSDATASTTVDKAASENEQSDDAAADAVDSDAADTIPTDAANSIPPTPTNSVDSDATSPNPLATWNPSNEQESTSTVLMRDTNGLVTQLAPGNVIGVGSTLVIPSGINTAISLPSGLKATNMGDSIVSLRDSAQSTTALEVIMCRWVLSNEGSDQPQRLQLRHAGKTTSIELAAGTRISLEASPRRSKHGSATEQETFKPVRTIIALSGSVVVRDPSSRDPIALNSGEGIALVSSDKARKFELQRVPNWLRPGSQRAVDTLGAADLSRELALRVSSGQTVNQALKQACETSRPETAAAAVRCSMLLGEFSALVPALSNPRLSAHWFSLLRLADQMIASDAASALASLQLTQGDAKGNDMLSLIAGPARDSINESAISQLIAGLEAKTLATRVLSIHRLRELTGVTLGYLPHRPSRESLAQWRRDLASERLKITPAPELLPERTPLL